MAVVVLDIETVALPEAATYLEPVTAPANYKDPAKIAEYCREKQAEQIARAALDPDLCQIVAIGYMRLGESVVHVRSLNLLAESAMLRELWVALEGPPARVACGFSIFAFDLPVLLRRSDYLVVTHPPVSLDRYRSPHIDLLQRLSFHGTQRLHSLEFYCRRFGIPATDPVTGSDIAGLVAAGQWNQVRAHVEADVTKTMALAQRLLGSLT